jgi:hypothetical protein
LRLDRVSAANKIALRIRLMRKSAEEEGIEMRSSIRCLFIFAFFVPLQAYASTLAFEDNKLNYRSCDGQHITARWRGTDFSLSLPGKSLGDSHKEIAFVAWDGRCLTGAWNTETGGFKLADAGETSSSGLIRYVAWDGSKWAGVRAGSGFFVARVAGAGEEITNDRLTQLADWLAKRNQYPAPGATLAKELTRAATP